MLKLKTIALFSVITVYAFFICSCKKETGSITNGETPPDLITKVTSSVSGFITDENEAAVNGAPVTVGNTNTTTDKYGYFEVKNAQVVKEAAVVTVNQPG